MADNYGPEAKKQMDETYQQIADVIKGGVSLKSINKVRQLIQDKTEHMKKFGDEAWKKGVEQAKPYLDKNPQVKGTYEDIRKILEKRMKEAEKLACKAGRDVKQ